MTEAEELEAIREELLREADPHRDSWGVVVQTAGRLLAEARMEIATLKEDRASLVARCGELERERDEARAKGHDIETALCRRLNALIAERDAAIKRAEETEKALYARLDKAGVRVLRLIQERDAAIEERDEWQAVKGYKFNGMTARELAYKHDEMLAERDAAVATRDSYIDANIGLAQEREDLGKELEAALARITQLETQLDATIKMRDQMGADIAQLEVDLDAVCKEAEELTEERDALIRERTEWEGRYQETLARARDLEGLCLGAAKTIDAQSEDIKNMEAANRIWDADYKRRIAEFEADLDRASKEHEAYITQLSTMQVRVKELEGQLTASWDDAKRKAEWAMSLQDQGAENARLREAFERLEAEQDPDQNGGWETGARETLAALRAALRGDRGEG
jgi:chromosome segregation ATPase